MSFPLHPEHWTICQVPCKGLYHCIAPGQENLGMLLLTWCAVLQPEPANLAADVKAFLDSELKMGVLRCMYVLSPAVCDLKGTDFLQVPSSVQWHHFGRFGVCSKSSRQCSGVEFILSLPQVLGWRWTEAGEIHCRHTERLCCHCCLR